MSEIQSSEDAEAPAPEALHLTPEVTKQTSLSQARVFEIIDVAQEIVVCGHVNPDGDAVGSNLALSAFLRERGHTVTSLLAQYPTAPNLYAFMPGYEFVPAAEYAGTPDLFIAVDTSTKVRLGKAAEIFDRAKNTLVIDHHPDYEGYSPNYFGDARAAATGLLIWDLLSATETPITRDIAEYCYVAIMTDTGRFSFQNTSSEAFEAAGEMIAAGVNPAEMSKNVYESRSLSSLMLDARLVSRIRFSGDGRIVYSWVNAADLSELKVTRDETEGLPTLLRSIRDVEVAILLREEEDGTRVNLRAKGSCDVGAVARAFGGGGHRAAAGITLALPLPEAIEVILSATEKTLG
ncbi:MAG: DHH family phosphoesterase [Coriobacteriales bacterium]|jgi:phosphoesterase RecJ-like protein|nr:DHH family phosphoesterase [Coriobacteriales bacterium]